MASQTYDKASQSEASLESWIVVSAHHITRAEVSVLFQPNEPTHAQDGKRRVRPRATLLEIIAFKCY